MTIRAIGAYGKVFLGRLSLARLTRLVTFARPRIRPMDVVEIRRAAMDRGARQVVSSDAAPGCVTEAQAFSEDALCRAGLVEAVGDSRQPDNHLRVIEALETPRNPPLDADQIAGRLDRFA